MRIFKFNFPKGAEGIILEDGDTQEVINKLIGMRFAKAFVPEEWYYKSDLLVKTLEKISSQILYYHE